MSQIRELPKDPVTQTKDRMAVVAADTAKNMALREAKSWLKPYLPRFLWPLLPGERGTVAGEAQKSVSKWFWGLVSSAMFSLFFFLAVAAVLFLVAAFIGYAVVMG